VSNERRPGPVCQWNSPQRLDDGTVCRAETPAPTPLGLCTKQGAPDFSWGYWDVVVWKVLPKWMGGDADILRNYKDAWVRGHRAAIKKAAKLYDLPPELLAGVAWIEAGGKPYSFKIDVYEVRTAVRLDVSRDGVQIFSLTKQPGMTSMGPVAIQLRRAAETMGLDFNQLSEGDKTALVNCLQNADNDLAIVAKHLWQLKEIDFPGKREIGKSEMRIIGTRYNRGPDLTLERVLRDTSYGDFIVNRIYERVEGLLGG